MRQQKWKLSSGATRGSPSWEWVAFELQILVHQAKSKFLPLSNKICIKRHWRFRSERVINFHLTRSLSPPSFSFIKPFKILFNPSQFFSPYQIFPCLEFIRKKAIERQRNEKKTRCGSLKCKCLAIASPFNGIKMCRGKNTDNGKGSRKNYLKQNKLREKERKKSICL